MKKTKRDQDEEKSREERLAYVGVLAAGLIHEIKTPLHAILLTVQMLVEDAERLPPDTRPRFERRCRRVHGEVKSLARMLDAFLSFARPPKSDPTPTDLNHFIRELVDFAKPEMDESGIILETNLAQDMYPVVMDKNQFTHVVLNLLKNARESIEASREQSEEDFEGRIIVATAEDEEGISLVIQDNGVGISPGDEEKVFEFFYTTKPKGTGLGLAMVQRTIEEHRGTIRVEHIPEPGARFVITLPRGHFLEFSDGSSTQPTRESARMRLRKQATPDNTTTSQEGND
ncbi:MAG: ATP-binding protein [Planctomycetaceae bacterium]|nr:ATP-binding protein [Planctomycetaceae bacterium]